MPPEVYLIPKSACLVMMVSAMEAYPKECMGVVLSSRRGFVLSAIPYQLARRRPMSVSSESCLRLERLFSRGCVRKMCDYHSHIYAREGPSWEVEPSDDDLIGTGVGGLEMIVGVRRVRSSANWIRNSGKGVLAALGTFRFKVALFEKLSVALLYDKIGLRVFQCYAVRARGDAT